MISKKGRGILLAKSAIDLSELIFSRRNGFKMQHATTNSMGGHRRRIYDYRIDWGHELHELSRIIREIRGQTPLNKNKFSGFFEIADAL